MRLCSFMTFKMFVHVYWPAYVPSFLHCALFLCISLSLSLYFTPYTITLTLIHITHRHTHHTHHTHRHINPHTHNSHRFQDFFFFFDDNQIVKFIQKCYFAMKIKNTCVISFLINKIEKKSI